MGGGAGGVPMTDPGAVPKERPGLRGGTESIRGQRTLGWALPRLFLPVRLGHCELEARLVPEHRLAHPVPGSQPGAAEPKEGVCRRGYAYRTLQEVPLPPPGPRVGG